jgi:CheY-like chemotaxis protein
VSLSEIIEQAIHHSRPLIDKYRHKLRCELLEEPIELEADPVRLTQVLVNLLNNAARYTPPEGCITVRVTHRPGWVDIRLTDNGRGMSSEFLPHAFDAFRQESEQSDNTGLGLGLALAHQIVSLHGGTLSANSKGIGQGSEFVLSLPLRETESQLQRTRQDTPRHPFHRPLSIMLIDDSEDVRELMAELLRSWGHRVAVAADGESGVALTLQNRPDVAFVDIGLPLLDGYGVASRVRAEAGGKVPRLIAMTGFGRDADKQRAHEVGFDQHIVKPASIEALRRALSFEDA